MFVPTAGYPMFVPTAGYPMFVPMAGYPMFVPMAGYPMTPGFAALRPPRTPDVAGYPKACDPVCGTVCAGYPNTGRLP